ncbi:MAG: histidinol-phosphatase [Verrucomicrobia bacterium]|nr:MAG: histidinol-phosphatase [Verrucomicrobiota bacterium]
MSARTDLHLYSKHSDRAADWLLRRLDFPASYSDPRSLYDMLRKAKMSFVTITDHNTLNGCLEIADRPHTFLSEEVTTYFPEDGCKIYLLIWGLNEKQHHEIHSIRENIYDLQQYLAQQQLAHAVAHPFHQLNEKLSPLHFQRLILLFRHFQSIDGRYNSLLSDSLLAALEGLTPERILRFQELTGLKATHEEPWKKICIGGSDDYGGVYPARAWTETPAASSPAEFLAHVQAGRCHAQGQSGTPLTLAHSTYNTAFQYAKSRFSMKPDDPATLLLERVFSRFMEGRNPTEFSFKDKFVFLWQGIATGKIFELARAGNNSLWKELSHYFGETGKQAEISRITQGIPESERRAFLLASLITNQLGYRFFSQFLTQLSAGRFLESLQLISPLVPMLGVLSPYLYGFRRERLGWLRSMVLTCREELPKFLKNSKRAWFTDTLEDVNGVTNTIRRMTAAGVAAGKDLTVIASRSQVGIQDIPIRNFPPVGEFELPEYELQRLSFPPILEMLEYIERERFSEVIISTPGPVGLTALLAAKMLGLRAVGIYHTDFPQYVRILTEDAFMETLTWNYMHWFYSAMDLIYVNSEDYRKCWRERGIREDKLRILPRGLQTDLFHPQNREEGFWKARGLLAGEMGILFVGRISKEKNPDVLVAAMRRLCESQAKIRPLIVGNGPYLPELKTALPQAIFTGYLEGKELAKAYASADVFVFPSITDTFGNVILEAHASGLPCIVTDQGGPRDLVDSGKDGFVIRSLDPNFLAERILWFFQHPEERKAMGRAGRAKVESRSWAKAFQDFWNDLSAPVKGCPDEQRRY